MSAIFPRQRQPMAALLQHGKVRWLGGSMLQQVQEEERHRLGTRFMHSKETTSRSLRMMTVICCGR